MKLTINRASRQSPQRAMELPRIVRVLIVTPEHKILEVHSRMKVKKDD
jgi:hypothetical protein